MLRVLLTLALGEALRAPGALRARPARRAAAPVSMMAGGAKKILVLGGDDPLLAGIGIGACIGGAFAIFEGWSGWCAIRAMGFRTPL